MKFEVKSVTSKLNKKSKECESLKERIRDVTINLPYIIKSTILREVVSMNLKNQDRKPRGRCYFDNQKLLSHNIEKLGPKCYKFLVDKLELSSTRTKTKLRKVFYLNQGKMTNYWLQ